MDCEITLPPRSLMNMLCEAYKSDEPVATLQNLLQPYHITYEQLRDLMAILFWPGRMSVNESHPFYVVSQKLTEYTHNTDTLAKREYFKKRFIYVATAVCHAWYARLRTHDHKFVLHRDPHFVAYQHPGASVPYVWFSFDKFGMPHVFASHSGMPSLEIELCRSTKLGDMLPLTLRFFDAPPPSSLPAPAGPEGTNTQQPSKIQMHVHNQQFLELYTFPSQTRNYVMFISEDLLLTRCIMVSPTTDKAWLIPVIMHKYE
jgi:hypothetical protein